MLIPPLNAQQFIFRMWIHKNKTKEKNEGKLSNEKSKTIGTLIDIYQENYPPAAISRLGYEIAI